MSAMSLNPRSVGIYVNRCVLEVLVEENKRLSLYYAMNKEEITPLLSSYFVRKSNVYNINTNERTTAF
jgi:hypothetical protein